MPEPFLWRVRIRFADTDASQRIHYTALFRHFEAAEEEFLRSLGFGYAAHADQDLGYPRVHAECDISGALEHDDEVELGVMVEKVGRSSYTLGFTVRKQGTQVATGRVVVVCMNKAAQKSQPLPAAFAHALRRTAPES